MFDTLFVAYAKRQKEILDPNYRPDDAVKSKQYYNTEAHKLAVVFPPWHSAEKLTAILVSRLIRKGWAVVLYNFHPQILEPEEKMVIESFDSMQSIISHDLFELEKIHHYQKIRLIGLSLGNVPLSMVSDVFTGFHEADIVVGGDDLALCLWYGERTAGLQKVFANEHWLIAQLEKAWRNLAPKSHIRHFADKRVNFIISKADSIIPTKYQVKLKEEIEQTGAMVTCRYRRLGHYLSVVRYCLLGSLA